MTYIPYRSDSINWCTQDCVYAVQDWLSVMRGDFNRYTSDAIYKALNNGQSKFTLLTECLTMPVLIVAQAYQQHYRLPDCVQKIQTGRYYYGSDRYSYQELTIKGSMRQMQDETLDFRGAFGSPAYYLFPSYKGDVVQFGIAMYPSNPGTPFNATNSRVLSFPSGTTWPGAATGTNKTAGASYIDSAGTNMASLGITVGLPIFNITNSAPPSGIITGITTTTSINDTLVASMGTNWAVSDQAVIPLPDWGLAIDSAVAGTALTAGANYVDSAGRNMSALGVQVGMNIVDGSQSLSGYITAIQTTNSTNDTLVASMGGNWAVGDNMFVQIPTGGVNTMVSPSGTIGDFQPFLDNIVLDVVRKPFPLLTTMPNFVPEIDSDYIEAVIGFAVYQLGRSAFKGLLQESKAAEGKKRFDELVEEYIEKKKELGDQSESDVTWYDIYS